MTDTEPENVIPRSEASRRLVLVTGCSSGIGRLCAIELARQGCNVLAGVRRDQDGEALSREQAANLTPVLLDVCSEESIQQAQAVVARLAAERGLDALVNNAGILTPGPLELLTAQQLHQQFEVNVFGVHRLTQAMLPWLRRAGEQSTARLVLVSSISGRITPPFFGAYAASKHALEAMGEAWRSELAPWNIAVSVVQPDSVATPIWDKAGVGFEAAANTEQVAVRELYQARLRSTRRQSLRYKRSGLATEVVVRSLVHAVNGNKPKSYYRVGWRTGAAMLAHSLLPTPWMDFVLRKSIGG